MSLFIGILLETAIEKVLMIKAVPEGQKPYDCKRGSECDKLPIPYTPKKDELHEIVDAVANMIKLTPLCKVKLQVSVFSHGILSSFLCTSNKPENQQAIKQEGLKEAYEKLVVTKKECLNNLEEAWLSLEISQSKAKKDST